MAPSILRTATPRQVTLNPWGQQAKTTRPSSNPGSWLLQPIARVRDKRYVPPCHPSTDHLNVRSASVWSQARSPGQSVAQAGRHKVLCAVVCGGDLYNMSCPSRHLPWRVGLARMPGKGRVLCKCCVAFASSWLTFRSHSWTPAASRPRVACTAPCRAVVCYTVRLHRLALVWKAVAFRGRQGSFT